VQQFSWFQLLQSFTSNLEFLGRCLVRLLDKAVQDHDASANQGAIKGSADAFSRLGTHFKQAITHGAGVRHSKVGAELHHSTQQGQVAGF
jgi:hypothetical protein